MSSARITRRLVTGAVGLLALALTAWTQCLPARARVDACHLGATLPATALGDSCTTPHHARDLLGSGSGMLGTPLGVPGSLGPVAGPAGTLSEGLGGTLGQGLGGIASTATTQLAFIGLQGLVSGSAAFVLHETSTVLAETTTPRLTSTWFSAAYWKIAGLAAILTLPFIFAAAIQALIRSDLTLLVRAAVGYLPLAMLAVAIAAPVTMLLLSASDELAAAVGSAAGDQSVNFLDQAIASLGAVGAASASPFLLFLLGLFTVAGALILWIELLMREAAVYVIVLMLPLAFAAFVWPARRIWVIRSLEVLVALILSKFAIVAVLSLGGLALGHSVHSSVAGMLAGIVLLILGAFTPWALLRLLPLAEMASGTAGALRDQAGIGLRGLQHADGWATEAQHWVSVTAEMGRAIVGTKAPGGGAGGSARDQLPDRRAEATGITTLADEPAPADTAAINGRPPAPAQTARGDET